MSLYCVPAQRLKLAVDVTAIVGHRCVLLVVFSLMGQTSVKRKRAQESSSQTVIRENWYVRKRVRVCVAQERCFKQIVFKQTSNRVFPHFIS